MKKQYIIPEGISPSELKEYRRSLGLTQQALADYVGVSKKTVERWESSGLTIHGPIVPLLRILREEPRFLPYFEVPEQTTILRLWYMYRSEVCTLIDVNEKDRTVSIRNYTSRMQYRAFGVNEEPSFEEYEQFLEDRCFPRGRDKMKLILEDLDIPFYDPLLIIEKTEGRMAEDQFWIRIERLKSAK